MIGWTFGLVGFFIGSRPFFDNSLFTHVATGRLILESGIPRADPYSFTAAGEPWVVQSWLVSVLYALAEKLGGDIGLRVLGGLLVAAVVVLAWRLTHPARSLLPRVLITGLVVAACGAFLSPRPLLVGLVLLEVALLIVLEGHDPRWLLPVMWIWVNSHGSFPLGIVAVAVLLAGTWCDGVRDRRIWRPLWWVLGGTALGVIGPLGPAIVVFPVHLLGRMEILSRVIEWQSPDFSELFARVFLVQVAVAVLVLVRRPSYRTALPLVVFLAAALGGQRNIPIASLLMVPGLAVGLADLGRLHGRERGPAPAVLAGAVTLLMALLISNQFARPAFDLTSYPTDAIAYLDQRHAFVADSRIATQDTVGNTLELLYGTRARAFFDDRYDMYPLAVSRDYLEINGGTPRWADALDRHQVQYLLWDRKGALAGLVAASTDWRILYQDPKAFVACRRGSIPDC